MEDITEHIKNVDFMLSTIKDYAVKGSRATTQVLLELYYVMIDSNTPKIDKFLIGVAIAYQTIPKDLLPTSKFGLLGYIDNVATLTFAYKKVKKAITPEMAAKVDETLNKWFANGKNNGLIEFEEID